MAAGGDEHAGSVGGVAQADQQAGDSLAPAPPEPEVLALGLRLAELGSGVKARAYEMSKVTELLMTLAMRKPSFQAQLFRLVDVFPAMSDAADTGRHVEEYFERGLAPLPVAAGAQVANRLPFGRAALARVTRREVMRMASQFIVGSDPAEVARELKAMWEGGTAATIDLLGEHTYSHHEADAYAARLLELVSALIDEAPAWPDRPLLESDDLGPLPRVAVSIKPSALAPDFHPLTADAGIESASRRLRPVLDLAAERGAQVWFDMERYEAKSLTIRLFQELLEEPAWRDLHAGIVVQAYLRDAADDLTALARWSTERMRRTGALPISIRLVKGAYWDTETIVSEAAGWPVPVFGEKAETDLNYERCVRILHGHHGRLRAAFGSHNLRSLAYAMATAEAAGIPPNGYELQLLYGMAEPVHEALRSLGRRLRVYAPMGELVPGMAYLVRRLLENTSQNSFVRHRFAEGKSLKELLAPPAVEAGQPASLRRLLGASKSAVKSALPEPAPRPELAVRPATDAAAPGAYRPEPLAEWFVPNVREAMAEALDTLSHALDFYVPARIGGKEVQTDRRLVSVDPADPERVVATSACCGAADISAAVAAAERAYHDWSRRPAAARAQVLFNAAKWLREHRFDVAALQVFEAGKGWSEADGDVCEAIDYLEYYGRMAIEMDRGGPVQSPPGERNTLTYRGRGVTAVISPWNFPLAIPTGMTSAALVAGNTVVLKPAEQTPATAQVLVRALLEGGLPDPVLNFVPAVGEEVGDGLVTHPDVCTVVFTGSKAVGLHLNEIGARVVPGQREVRRVFAEMGGKNAIIVDSDADLDVAVPAAVQSAFGFAGQRCSAASRLVVLSSVYEQFVERFVEAARALRIGPPREMGTEMGPVIDEDALTRIRSWQERAPEFGKVLLQRDDLPDRGYFVGPTIVGGVDPSSEIAQTEIFGPVVAVVRANTIEEGVAIASSVEYGLTAGLISRSPSHIRYASEELRAGNIYINRTITGAVVGRQPFGGYGMSGFGQKAGGPDYLFQFVEPRVVSENTMRQGFAPGIGDSV
jgi:RHH-type proline utilization regulon transcriptional repressor/proline dehydrogenase/delta 1-pyrroline-5-carboxylate dehydrogenase